MSSRPSSRPACGHCESLASPLSHHLCGQTMGHVRGWALCGPRGCLECKRKWSAVPRGLAHLSVSSDGAKGLFPSPHNPQLPRVDERVRGGKVAVS